MCIITSYVLIYVGYFSIQIISNLLRYKLRPINVLMLVKYYYIDLKIGMEFKAVKIFLYVF